MKTPITWGFLFCVLTFMAIAYTSSSAVPTSTKAFVGHGPLTQHSMNYGQAGSVAESPSGYNSAIFNSRVPFSTGMNINPTGSFVFSNESGLLPPLYKLIVMNSAIVNKTVVWVGVNAIGTGVASFNTGMGIPLSGGSSIEFGGYGTAPVRNAWAISTPGNLQTINAYGQYSNYEGL